MTELILSAEAFQRRTPNPGLLSAAKLRHRSAELDLDHLRSLAKWRQDDKAFNFAFAQDKLLLRSLADEYLVMASLLRAASRYADGHIDRGNGLELEKLVDFCAALLSSAEIPIKAPALPAFQDFLSSAIQWFRSLRNSVFVVRFWDSLYAMLTMDLASQPGIRERILGEVADIGRQTPIPPNLAAILVEASERPYIFGDPRQYLRVLAYIIKQLTLRADTGTIIEKWLFRWSGYLGMAKFKDKTLQKEQFEMKDDIHRGIGYLIGPGAILTGRYGGFLVSLNLLLIKLDHLLVSRRRAGYTKFGRRVFGLMQRVWRRPRFRRLIHVAGRMTPLGTVPKDRYRRELEIFDGPVLTASRRALIVTRVQGGLGDIMMMRPGLLELAKRRSTWRVHFATNRAFFAAFSADDPVTLVDIESTRIDLSSFRRWNNFSDCPATRVEGREFPRIKTNRIDIFARALGIRFGLFSDRTRPYAFPPAIRERAEQLLRQHHRPGTLCIGIQYRSAETYRDIPAILSVARELAKQHTVFVIDNVPIPRQEGDMFIPVTGEKLQVALALVAMTDFMIGPDSSFFHIAGACRIPGIALFGPTGGKVRTKAYPTIKHVDLKQKMACIPCWRNETSPCNVSGGYESICTNALTTPIILERIVPIIDQVRKNRFS